MTRQEWIRQALLKLEKGNSPTPRLDAEVLLAHVLGLERLKLHMYPEVEVNHPSAELFLHLVHRRAQGEPVAYLTGTQEFMGLSFGVSPAVLIPRPDTELLVESVLAYLEEERQKEDEEGLSQVTDLKEPLQAQTKGSGSRKAWLAADIGTGSGCIAISLTALFPALTIMAVDLSKEALKVAWDNINRHLVEDRVLLRHGDLLDPVREWTDKGKLLDVIVSNPPYITEEEMTQLDPSVARYEPHSALTGGREGLDFYRRLTEEAPTLLGQGGLLALEIGHEQGSSVAALMKHQGFSQVKVLQDLAGYDRVVLGRRSNEEVMKK